MVHDRVDWLLNFERKASIKGHGIARAPYKGANLAFIEGKLEWIVPPTN